eukprot:maker-scaffold_4-snap-gene-5.62-mRNA-1 protein AED:0.08 eAED:0.08 QI:0/0/0.66/1/0.5/0.33/3/1170/220
MGKKKKRKVESTQPVPWCFYCGRLFGDEPILVQHQKARHFRCTGCKKRFVNARQLTGHLSNVHKISIDKCMVANALEAAVKERMKKDPNLAKLAASVGVVVPKKLLPVETTRTIVTGPDTGTRLNKFGEKLPPALGENPDPSTSLSSQNAVLKIDPKLEDLSKIEVTELIDLEGLVYREKNISPEEKRAKKDKYNANKNSLEVEAQNLDKDIDSMLAKFT